MFDHASVRPRVLRTDKPNKVTAKKHPDDNFDWESGSNSSGYDELGKRDLFASTIFGPTCDSIDVVARSVLLPKLKVGDWLYFGNMGAYTMAAASGFNGFMPSKRFYVCSVLPEYFEALIQGPDAADVNHYEEKKDN
jgi:Pyridoxal-dependent decarboxylase, C-terminal sheet domain